MKFLPVGAMRRERRIGRIEGVLLAVALTLTIGAAVVAATPVELYRGVQSTTHPIPQPVDAVPGFVEIGPCTDMSEKDCMSTPDPARPTPWRDNADVRTVPAPSTLLLIVAAGLAWIVAGIVVGKAVSINQYGDDDDERR